MEQTSTEDTKDEADVIETKTSDHDWSNHYLVMGGSVLGGRFYGTYPSVVVGTTRDYPLFSVARNFRGSNVPEFSMDQYGNTLANWFGLSDAAASDVFPNIDRFPTRVLGFMNKVQVRRANAPAAA